MGPLKKGNCFLIMCYYCNKIVKNGKGHSHKSFNCKDEYNEYSARRQNGIPNMFCQKCGHKRHFYWLPNGQKKSTHVKCNQCGNIEKLR